MHKLRHFNFIFISKIIKKLIKYNIENSQRSLHKLLHYKFKSIFKINIRPRNL